MLASFYHSLGLDGGTTAKGGRRGYELGGQGFAAGCGARSKPPHAAELPNLRVFPADGTPPAVGRPGTPGRSPLTETHGESRAESESRDRGAGIRSTGIGCYFDDPVHDVFGLVSRDWQIYDFTVGGPLLNVTLESLAAVRCVIR